MIIELKQINFIGLIDMSEFKFEVGQKFRILDVHEAFNKYGLLEYENGDIVEIVGIDSDGVAKLSNNYGIIDADLENGYVELVEDSSYDISSQALKLEIKAYTEAIDSLSKSRDELLKKLWEN